MRCVSWTLVGMECGFDSPPAVPAVITNVDHHLGLGSLTLAFAFAVAAIVGMVTVSPAPTGASASSGSVLPVLAPLAPTAVVIHGAPMLGVFLWLLLALPSWSRLGVRC